MTEIKITEAARIQAKLIGGDPLEVQKLLNNPALLLRMAGKLKFRDFIRFAWPHIEPNPFVPGWHIDAIADHMQAVSDGDIKRLLINVPPRTSKSTITSVMWPCWTWAQDTNPNKRLVGAAVRFVFASYAQSLGVSLSIASRRLLESEWYKMNYMGKRFFLAGDQNNKLQYDTSLGGSRLVASTDGGVTGRGGDIFAIDDPHSTQEAESDIEREGVLRWWRQTVQSRLNDPKSGAFVIIMQRLHEADLSGYILDTSEADWVHLMLPMMHEKGRHCVTVKLPHTGKEKPWEDPRTEEGELLAPLRFDQKYVDLQAREVGPYVFAGQYQQRPAPAGGEIFKLDWWHTWEFPKYPVFDLMIASLDTAYTEKQENDYSALTIWGTFSDRNGLPQLMLVYAWKERLQVNDLVQKVGKTCRRPMYPVDRVLIESKANGISVAQELVRLFGTEDFAVDLIDPKGDKTARALSVQPLFAPSTRTIKLPDGTHKSFTTEGIVWTPDKAWADMVKNEAASFPKGRHDDLVDSMVQGLKWLRSGGFAKRREERLYEMVEQQRYQPPAEALYDV